MCGGDLLMYVVVACFVCGRDLLSMLVYFICLSDRSEIMPENNILQSESNGCDILTNHFQSRDH